jgi:hypothetical protein
MTGDVVLAVLTGALLCNSIPHLAKGMCGERFPTPFARLRGQIDSAPPTNVVWGLFNAIFGLRLLASHPVAIEATPRFAALLAGALVLGVFCSIHFARVRAKLSG